MRTILTFMFLITSIVCWSSKDDTTRFTVKQKLSFRQCTKEINKINSRFKSFIYVNSLHIFPLQFDTCYGRFYIFVDTLINPSEIRLEQFYHTTDSNTFYVETFYFKNEMLFATRFETYTKTENQFISIHNELLYFKDYDKTKVLYYLNDSKVEIDKDLLNKYSKLIDQNINAIEHYALIE